MYTRVRSDPITVISSFIFTILMLVAGYASFGIYTSIIFSGGFLGGFLLWLISPANAKYEQIKTAYWATLAAFLFLHKVEENIFEFQKELAKITGTPVPELTSPWLIILVVSSLVGWLLIPTLVKRRSAFGYYLAWTFFASMGITELAHFILPFFKPDPYGYFPGMGSVIILAPLAWWGMSQLRKSP